MSEFALEVVLNVSSVETVVFAAVFSHPGDLKLKFESESRNFSKFAIKCFVTAKIGIIPVLFKHINKQTNKMDY